MPASVSPRAKGRDGGKDGRPELQRYRSCSKRAGPWHRPPARPSMRGSRADCNRRFGGRAGEVLPTWCAGMYVSATRAGTSGHLSRKGLGAQVCALPTAKLLPEHLLAGALAGSHAGVGGGRSSATWYLPSGRYLMDSMSITGHKSTGPSTSTSTSAGTSTSTSTTRTRTPVLRTGT